MSDVNKVILVGGLGSDAKMFGAVTKWGMATSERIPGRDGADDRDVTTWHDVVAFGKLAQRCAELRKGARVCVEGRLSKSSWDDKATGEKKYKTEVIADAVYLLGQAGERSADRSGGSHGRRPTLPVPSDDDIPF